MTAKKVVLRRAVGAAVALVLALAVVGPVAAGKRPPPATGDKTPPTTPTDLHATSLGQTSVMLAWNPSTDNSGNVTYVVYDSSGAPSSPSWPQPEPRKSNRNEQTARLVKIFIQ
jgi:hypothetical protein